MFESEKRLHNLKCRSICAVTNRINQLIGSEQGALAGIQSTFTMMTNESMTIEIC